MAAKLCVYLTVFENRTRTYGKYIPALLSFGDLLLFNIFYVVTVWLYPELAEAGRKSLFLYLLVNLSFIPVALRVNRTKTLLRAMQLDRVVLQALMIVVVHALCFMAIIAFFGITIVPTRAFVVYYAMMMVAITLWAIISGQLIKYFRRKGYNYIRVAIVGTNASARRLYDAMLSDDGYGYKILGFFDRKVTTNSFAGRHCGLVEELDEFVKENNIDHIYFALSEDDDSLNAVVKVADDNVVDFFYVPQISQNVLRGFEISTISTVPVLTLMRNPLRKNLSRLLKRSFDIFMSGIFLCFYPLIYIPIAIAIKLTSPGPVYFKQQRTGYRGSEFTCLKFRTMHVNKDSDKAQATQNDPRKTRLGHFLRRTNLDELPQFINVFKGDMSVVGPRPHMLKHTEDYTKLVDRYMVRHYVKPGITGWAQVNGYRGITDELWKMEKRVQHDVWYIENWTFLLDLKIIVRTVINAIAGEKNAF